MRTILFILVLTIMGCQETPKPNNTQLAFTCKGRGCSGNDNCSACKNCTGCRHCAKEGGTCGVCAPEKPKKKKRK